MIITTNFALVIRKYNHVMIILFYGSTESKAQVSYSDRKTSIVRRRRCRHRCRRTLFTFSYSPESVG